MTFAAATTPGATAGPVDMSVTLNLYTPEASLLALALGDSAAASTLQGRLVSAEQSAESNGATSIQLLISPAEQGMLMACLRQCTCQFSSQLRGRVQSLMTNKLSALNAPVL